ncbi:NAD(P)/FAD-dependent oxidoreductase [Nocardioides sp. ChNu-153]|uniref:NAD(P)/FAD-dependent oxidoreductase n=1 Tax=unclassified Nocardioides TaxID=2615069 RepID=UPI002404B43E|nr:MULTISPECIES: NAD(P)/FAD-dependent oxidoreductase [unclassified Nocardioides]MDF9716199.1 NAD(P)/FAD-dependent oxidoreductase [Nocardioides sp. ChNu-99]MDN7121589.1 NAD(P)/FAD-dependent oxidoreductase [Nocardioides sp. ChNu-153]
MSEIRNALVVGGGPAGLQAALTLGRIHRSTTLVDSGTYRNAQVDHMHNVATHDGRPPAEFRAQARAQLDAYDVVVREATVRTIEGDVVGGFTATLDDGSTVRAKRVVLATGLTDELPDVPGLADLWGTVAAQCPFCHGHEFADGHVVVLGAAQQMSHAVGLMRGIAGEITVLANGAEVAPEARTIFAALGAAVVEAKVERFERRGDGARVVLSDGSEIDAVGVLLAPTYRQSAPFAAQLGVELLPSGCVEIDDMGRTSVTGVYAGGDLAHRSVFPMPMASVVNALAAGQMAATACSADLLGEEMAALGAAGH